MLKYIGFCGVDDTCDIDVLLNVIKEESSNGKNIQVELGVLFRKEKQGIEERFASMQYVDKLMLKAKDTDIRFAAHLCSIYVDDILENGNDEFIQFLIKKNFKRFQINATKANGVNTALNSLKSSQDNLLQVIRSLPKHTSIILQLNDETKELIEAILESVKSNPELHYLYNQINILFDASIGRGIEMKEVKQPFHDENILFGYAGGINSSNIGDILKMISSELDDDKPFWIDMESSLRTTKSISINNKKQIVDSFNVEIVKKCLKIAFS